METTTELTEVALAEKLGLPRSLLSQIRKEHLREGEHWSKIGGWIIYNEAGIQATRDQLGLAAQKKEGGGEIETVEVTAHPINIRIVVGCLADGSMVRVRVTPSQRKKYPPGSSLRAKPVGDLEAGLYQALP